MTIAIEKGRYCELMQQFPLSPLCNKTAYKQAMAAADQLAIREAIAHP